MRTNNLMPGSPKVRPPIHPNGDHTTIGNDSQLLIDNLRCDQLAKSIDRDYSEDRDITDENADTAENFDNDDTYTDEPAITETDNVTESPPSEPPTERPHHTNYLNKWNILIFVVVALIALLWRESSKTLAKNINCDVSLLKNEFPEQNQLFWKTLKSGIESTVNKDPTIPSVFLVVYQDKDLIQKFANQIINFTQNCMETNLYKPVILTNAELSGAEVLRDYGNAIEQYRTQIADSGVLFVEDLNTIPGPVARAFHSICDTVSPMVSRLIVFMTMHVDQPNQPILRQVEAHLKSNWSDLQPNVFDPLLARVTDQILILSQSNQLM